MPNIGGVNSTHVPPGTLLILAGASALVACGGAGAPTATEVADPIVGGGATTIAAHPWQISLQDRSGSPFCGGSILDASWILTAAHCVEGSTAPSLRVVAGVTRLSEARSGQVRGVDRVISFPGYETSELGKDAALLHLDRPLDLGGSNARAISITTQEDEDAGLTDPGVTSVVSGWGTTRAGGFASPDALREVAVPIVALQVASEAYGFNLSSDQLAAGEGGKDSCQGDSGGPLTVTAADGRSRLLAGVVSWGSGCGDPGYPGLYARVSRLAPWIQGHLASGTSDHCPTEQVSAGDLPRSIPDAVDTGLRSELAVSARGSAARVVLSLDLAHTYRADLRVALVSPSGRSVVVHDRTGGSADDLVFEALEVPELAGEALEGTWALNVQDLEAADVGTLRGWSLTLTAQCPPGQ